MILGSQENGASLVKQILSDRDMTKTVFKAFETTNKQTNESTLYFNIQAVKNFF